MSDFKQMSSPKEALFLVISLTNHEKHFPRKCSSEEDKRVKLGHFGRCLKFEVNEVGLNRTKQEGKKK